MLWLMAHGATSMRSSGSATPAYCLQKALDQGDLIGRVVDGLRDIDDAFLIAKRLDDFGTVFPLPSVARREEGRSASAR